jgi:hypothetical protein
VILGILLVLAAISLVVRAIRARIQLAVLTSVIGLLSILAAFFTADPSWLKLVRTSGDPGRSPRASSSAGGRIAV